ncbi:MAG: hypothetical protein UV73_C0011G0003 [Candidatus Gottesmanbacteria bacterium GW2011_GWA2_43_14]|uniref:UPF0102 protein UV73_C0011G0003 n=1 Tax=Candidatus Gottesmanbacteria bacterium GW2011_GWA2_43_14 TaxID=1618443 RepID=A0A0G1FMT9_9BACT|nr:MAG: hypothetical protein UV73_C0011G0003 [Candidatus Gottesmanbacteria bacterium GW2011_GWA2_43_14]
MKKFNRATGRLAEDMATDALLKNGFKIIQRNYANRYGEIDIIAKDGETVVFIEVKAKTGNRFGTPEEMINRKKLTKIRQMAEIYMSDKNSLCRIDVVAIILNNNKQLVSLSHYRNVY